MRATRPSGAARAVALVAAAALAMVGCANQGTHCFRLAQPSAADCAKRWQVGYPQARQSHGRPFGPVPIASILVSSRP